MTTVPPAELVSPTDPAALISQVTDYAIIALDSAGTIESWNAGAERLKGYRSDEAVGRSFTMFYPLQERIAGLPLQLLEQARRDGSVAHTGWRQRKDGTLFWGDVVITALHAVDGRHSGFAKVTRDLTVRHREHEAELAFYKLFAHDFLTPAQAVRGFAQLLREATPADQAAYLSRIEDNTERLARMLANLVDHANRHVATTPSRPENLGLTELVRAVEGQLGAAYDVGRIAVYDDGRRIYADRVAMERVLVNVVGNALSYSVTGPVEVRTGPGPVQDGTVAVPVPVPVTVSDHGRGIDAADLPTIMEEFQRGRLATADGGSGLGLASARILVEEQGGTIEIASTIGVGTEVTLTVPAAANDSARLSTTPLLQSA